MADLKVEPNGVRFRAGGGAVLPHLTRNVELSPYDTFYRQVELLAQVEKRSPSAKLTLFSRDFPIHLNAGLGQSDISGAYQNLGSNRQLYYLSAGARLYFPDVFFAEGQAGAGVSLNQLDFGKGFPVETGWGANAVLRGGLGAEYCVADSICFSAGAYWHFDQSFLHGTAYMNHGPSLMVMASGHRDTVVYDKREIELKDIRIKNLEERHTETVSEKDQKISELKIEIRTLEREVERVKEVAEEECEKSKESADPEKLVAQTNENAEKQALLSPVYVYFANDNPDQSLQYNWFPIGKGKAARNKGGSAPDRCLSHPQLDVFMRALASLKSRRDLKFVVRVQGSANDTGKRETNERLAEARSQFVIEYITKQWVSVPTGLLRVHGKEVGRGRLRNTAGSRNGYQICGALDSLGHFSHVIDTTSGVFQVVNENIGKNYIPDKIDPSDPKYRYARIEVDIYKNGKKLTGDDRAEYIMQLNFSSDKKKEKGDDRMQ